MATKKQTKQKAKPATKKATKEIKACEKKYLCDGVSMKNFLILWICITVLILMVVMIAALLIPMIKQ